MSENMLISHFFVGVGKSGTSWLYKTLGRHSEVSVPKIKEPYLLDMPVQTARKHIEGLYSGVAHFCEFSNTYYFDIENPRKIVEHNPEARVILTTRLPSDRIKSHFTFLQRSGLVGVNTTLATYLDNGDEHEIVARSDYQTIYNRYSTMLGVNKILVLPLELLKSDSQAYFDKLTDFMGVSRMMLTEQDSEPVLKSARARSIFVVRLARGMAQLLRQFGLLHLLAFFKKSSMINQLLFREAKGRQLLVQSFGNKADYIAQLDSRYDAFVQSAGNVD